MNGDASTFFLAAGRLVLHLGWARWMHKDGLKKLSSFLYNVDRLLWSCVSESNMHKATGKLQANCFRPFVDSHSHCFFSFILFLLLNSSFSIPKIQIPVPKVKFWPESMATSHWLRKQRYHSVLLPGEASFLVQSNCLQNNAARAKTLHCLAFPYVHYCVSEYSGLWWGEWYW